MDQAPWGAPLRLLALEAVGRWQALGRPLVGAYIHGSSARRGAVAPDSDLDLCIVVPAAPDPTWFEEWTLGGAAVEVVPLDHAALADPDAVLADPALPFGLCEGILLQDPGGALHRLRLRLAPDLCASGYRHRRAATCYGRARAAYEMAYQALQDADVEGAGVALTVGLRHTLGLDAAIACRCPTNRRGFATLAASGLAAECPELVVLARQALGCADLTERGVRSLAEAAGLIKERHRRGVLAMVEQGEVEWAAWPLLHAALWRSVGATLHPEARTHILTAIGYESPAGLQRRYEAARRLTTSMWQCGHLLPGVSSLESSSHG